MVVPRWTIKGQKVGGPNFWKSMPLTQNSWDNPPIHWCMKLPTPIKTDNPIPWCLLTSEMDGHTLVYGVYVCLNKHSFT